MNAEALTSAKKFLVGPLLQWVIAFFVGLLIGRVNLSRQDKTEPSQRQKVQRPGIFVAFPLAIFERPSDVLALHGKRARFISRKDGEGCQLSSATFNVSANERSVFLTASFQDVQDFLLTASQQDLQKPDLVSDQRRDTFLCERDLKITYGETSL